MAEIEHFVDPLDKSHKKFSLVANDIIPLLTAASQESDNSVNRDLTVGEAVKTGVINNETIAYFMARTYLFLQQCGIRADGIRFRQHRSNEMAHYAQDCWDAEVECSYGWIEVAGHSDRSCYDLTKHAEKTKTELNAARPLKEVMIVKYIHVSLEKSKVAKTFKKDSKIIVETIDKFTDEQKEAYLLEMEEKKSIELKTPDQ